MTVHIEEQQDRRAGIITSTLFMLLLCIVLYFVTFMIGKVVPPDIPPLKSDEVIEEFLIDNVKLMETGGGSGGSGTSSNDRQGNPQEQSERVVTQQTGTFNHFSGNSNNHTAPNSTNESSSVRRSENPFGTGGDGGGEGAGAGGKFGNDAGSGTGRGSGDGIGDGRSRTRLNNANVDHIETQVNVTLNFELIVNENGDVVSARSTHSTTTTDQRIINQAKSAVIAQVKYKKEPGAGLVKTYYTIQINAQ